MATWGLSQLWHSLGVHISTVPHSGFGYKENKGSGEALFLAKTDIKSDYELLGFKWREGYYYDRCLPMGCSISCSIFEKFSTALQWAAMKRMQGVDILHVLDDFLFLSHSREGCKEALDTFLEMCKEIGVPRATEKTEGPCQILTF